VEGQLEEIVPRELNRLRKKGLGCEGFNSRLLQGLKPDVDLVVFIGMTEVMP
jgi:hypothetical protein